MPDEPDHARIMACDDQSPQCLKQPFPEVLTVPRCDECGGECEYDVTRLDWWGTAYYESARQLASGVLKGHCEAEGEGVVGVFLFRHYLEISLKTIIFHSRFITEAQTEAAWNEIEAIRCNHKLDGLWYILKEEVRPKVPIEEWERIDVAFVDKCVAHFHSIDPAGTRFRYPTRFGFGSDPQGTRVVPLLKVDFAALLSVMAHIKDIFDYLDARMLKNYAEIWTANHRRTSWPQATVPPLAD